MSEFYDENISVIFDEYFEKIIKHLPWIGKKYSTSKNKILVVGESVYNWGKNQKEIQEVNEKLAKSDFIKTHVKYHGLFHTLNQNQKGSGKKVNYFQILKKVSIM